MSATCRRHVVRHDIFQTFWTDTQKTPTFCCDWHVKLCQCVSTVNKMSVVSDIASPSDILGHVSENVSDTTFHVSNVSDVCQMSGVLLTDIKSTYPAKSISQSLLFIISSYRIVIKLKKLCFKNWSLSPKWSHIWDHSWIAVNTSNMLRISSLFSWSTTNSFFSLGSLRLPLKGWIRNHNGERWTWTILYDWELHRDLDHW